MDTRLLAIAIAHSKTRHCDRVHVGCNMCQYCWVYDWDQLTVRPLPMTLERFCSRFDAALPWLGVLIEFEVLVMVGKEAFVFSSQMVLEEIDHMEKPAKVNILLVFTNKNWLLSWRRICLVLRYVEMRDLGIAEARVQGDRGQTKLDSIDKGAIHACRYYSAHITLFIHVVIKSGTEDRVDDIDV